MLLNQQRRHGSACAASDLPARRRQSAVDTASAASGASTRAGRTQHLRARRRRAQAVEFLASSGCAIVAP